MDDEFSSQGTKAGPILQSSTPLISLPLRKKQNSPAKRMSPATNLGSFLDERHINRPSPRVGSNGDDVDRGKRWVPGFRNESASITHVAILGRSVPTYKKVVRMAVYIKTCRMFAAFSSQPLLLLLPLLLLVADSKWHRLLNPSSPMVGKNHKLGFWAFLFFLLLLISSAFFHCSALANQIRAASRANDRSRVARRFSAYKIKNTRPAPFLRDEDREGNAFRKWKKKARNIDPRSFSAMLPKGFVPPSGSSPCHNDAPESESIDFYCDYSNP